MKPRSLYLVYALAFCCNISLLNAQEIKIGEKNGEVTFEEYEPKSTLVVPGKVITRAKFPFIDVHNHQGEMDEIGKVKTLVGQMDSMNMGTMVNLSGRGWSNNDESDSILFKQIRNTTTNFKDRFVVFTNINFSDISKPDWTKNAVALLEKDVKVYGAKGLKIFKSLGFSVKESDGKLVPVDDPRLDPIWAKCGELNIPVLIHTGDPASFWNPMDKYNERWLELKIHGRRKRDASKGDFSFEELIKQQHNVFRKHKNTKFINAHMGWYPNDLQKLDSLLTALPNIYVEIGAVISELGRQPRTAKKFFDKNQDRILFGKDSYVPEEYATYFRVLESEDEYFPYHKKYHAFWKMYGLGLSDDVLKKVYYKNALKLFPFLDRSRFPE
jgi:uncharacterized protein